MTLREQIQRDEGGFQPSAYQDSEGWWTIGFGRLIDKRKGGRISLAEAELMLDNDIHAKTVGVYAELPWVEGLDEPRRAVIIGMAFNVGVQGLLGFKNMLAAVKTGEWSDAADHLMASKMARQIGRRADRWAQQLRTGEWQ